jgi:DNA-binding transcriptional regulator YiaG
LNGTNVAPIMVKKTWKSLTQSRLSPEAEARVRARVAAELEACTLKALRQELALTQVEVGRSLAMSQSELSRLESRSDHLTSTLRRYVEALGGELEVTAVFGDRRVKLTDA